MRSQQRGKVTETTLVVSRRWGVRLALRVEAANDATNVELELASPAGVWARGAAAFPPGLVGPSARQAAWGAAVEFRFAPAGPGAAARRWAVRFIAADDEPIVQVCERAAVGVGAWSLRLGGEEIWTHRQLSFLPLRPDEARFRLGAFTQHGQLLDLKDWFFVESGGLCRGMLAIRPGTWSRPDVNVLSVRGEPGGARVELPLAGPGALRRSYLLACAPAEEVLRPQRRGIEHFEPEAGFAAWPARRIARYGFARPERLAAIGGQVERMDLARPERFAFGEDDALDRAMRRVAARPELTGGHPLWRGDYAAARAWMLATLRERHDALIEAGYLHPLGNPVACRNLGPACAVFHMLDRLGELGEADRREAAGLIPVLAELLARRDFYPWHVATKPLGEAGSVQAIYRGMLNQNFNTDRYGMVGLAGCVLPAHPRAAAWRAHAVEQFRRQMAAYVWPGGAWEESHTYANHVKLILLPLAAALRRAPEGVDLSADERFDAMCRFFVRLLSPPDAILDGRRGIPAVGDHQYAKHGDFTYLFGWLAGLAPRRREEYLWAWRETGGRLTDGQSFQASTFSPLLIGEALDAGGAGAIDLPGLMELPGYGAAARWRPHTPDESLLVVRCGQSWGHYHHDQGSFWWWCRGRLICADAGLGDGPLKHRHEGHCVLGWPGRQPMQYLDRVDYHVDECRTEADGTVVIRCQVPVVAWQIERTDHEPIAPASRPHHTRTFHWRPPDRLTITDRPVGSPDGVVSWSLHVAAESVRREGPRAVRFELGAGAGSLLVELPVDPRQIDFDHQSATCGVTCTYPEGELVHHLAWSAKSLLSV